MAKDFLLEATKDLYQKNRRHKDGYSYTIPSEDTYPYQWLWDSCFSAIVMTHFDTDSAKAELQSLVSAQFKNGMIPHMIYWDRQKDHPFPEIKWGKRRTSSITQPPLLASAVERIYRATNDVEFVREMLPHIDAFHRYLIRHRDPRKLNIIGVINPDESGEDNSPRYDAALGLKNPRHDFIDNFSSRLKLVDDWRQARFVVKQRMDLHHWVYDVPINSILAESLAITAELARLCHEPRVEAWSHAKSEAVKDAMRKYMRKDGLYWPIMDHGQKASKIKIKTWAMFMPLYSGVATQEEAAMVVSRYLNNPEYFNTFFGVPTVAEDEPSFNPDGDWKGEGWIGTNWRGPVWIGSNWLIIQGLRRYGFNKEADRIAKQSRTLVKKSGFREYYDPKTGNGHGAKGFTWGGLALDM